MDEKKKKKKKFKIDIKKMGVNIDKNEYYEIICSNSAHPEDAFKKYRDWEILLSNFNWKLLRTLKFRTVEL